MRFLTLLSFFFFGTAMADSFPFGSGTLPYLLKGSDSVAIVKQFAETPDGNWWLSLDEVLYGEPMDSVNVMKIARTVSAPAQLAPESGNLIFLKRFTPEEIRKRGDKAEWYVVSSYLGIYRSEERIQATRSYLAALTDEAKLNWAMDLLRNTRDADLFFSATLALQNVNPSIVSENLVGELLNKFPPRTLGAYGVWNLLLKTGSKQVFEAFRSWLENPKTPQRNELISFFYQIPESQPLFEQWILKQAGDPELQELALKCWYAKDRAWSEEKEKDFRNRLGDNDPRVKLDAIAELSGKGFFGASTPSYILGEMLLNPDEIQLVKISILNAWVANQSLEALHFMERYSLDTQNSEANIKMVMQYGSKITLYDSGKRMLQRLEEAFEKSSQKTLKRWATFLLRK